MKKLMFYLLPFILVLFLTGCIGNESPTKDVPKLTIAAAANVTNAFTEIGPLFEAETGTKVTFSFGSTGQLAEQLINGAPFDVFASADIKTVEKLKDNELILADTKKTYAYGKIGIATLKSSGLKVETLEDFLNPEVVKIAIANPEHAPFGFAAKEALENVDLWAKIEDKIVYGRNIADTVGFIETGNAETGIIARSLVNEDLMDYYPIEESLYTPIGQAVAVTKGTRYEEEARAFIEFIKGPIGKPIMERYGFVVPEQ